ncbi:hypothetical protein HUSEC_14980, partial [Escherichia coli O104:H4 str. LB226692]
GVFFFKRRESAYVPVCLVSLSRFWLAATGGKQHKKGKQCYITTLEHEGSI